MVNLQKWGNEGSAKKRWSCCYGGLATNNRVQMKIPFPAILQKNFLPGFATA